MKTRGDEEHKKTNKRYNEDFKRTVVDLYHSGYSVKELSSEYGISEVTIYKWIKEFTPLGEAGQSIAPKEIAAMQKEMLRLKQEVEEMKGIGNNWNVIRGMVIKMHLTKRYNDKYTGEALPKNHGGFTGRKMLCRTIA